MFVLKARDTKLGREVAKTLPEEFANDKDRRVK